MIEHMGHVMAQVVRGVNGRGVLGLYKRGVVLFRLSYMVLHIHAPFIFAWLLFADFN